MLSAGVLLPKAEARRCGRGGKAPAACRGHNFPLLFFARVRKHQAYQALLTPNPSSCSSAVQAVPCRSLVPNPTCRLQDVDGLVVVILVIMFSFASTGRATQITCRAQTVCSKTSAAPSSTQRPGWTRPARLLVTSASSSTPALLGRTHPARETCAGGPLL